MITTVVLPIVCFAAIVMFFLWRGSLVDYRWLMYRNEWLESQLESDGKPLRCAGCGKFVKADGCIISINGAIQCRKCGNEK